MFRCAHAGVIRRSKLILTIIVLFKIIYLAKSVNWFVLTTIALWYGPFCSISFKAVKALIMIKMKLGKPYLMAHAGGKKHGKENSVKSVKNCGRYKPDILELDLRKSRDGVLFCYHGFPDFPVFFLAYFLRFLKFKTIKKFLKVDTLKEILDVVNWKTIVFLDIKQTNISGEEIDGICGNYDLEFWLAFYKFNYFKFLKDDLEDSYKYIYNFGFVNFRRGFKKVKRYGVDAMKIFTWQCSEKNMKLLKDSNSAYTVQPLFTSRKRLKKLIREHGSLWIALDDMANQDRLLRTR